MQYRNNQIKKASQRREAIIIKLNYKVLLFK